jgi:hypothetical protein
MKKILALALIGVGTVAVATPAMARPHHERSYRHYENYNYRGGYTPGVVSYTDRDGDGYDDRDRNFNGYIDPWEQGGNGYRGGNGNYSATDRNGDGYDDRDTNFNGYIDPWEYRPVRPR